MPSPASATHKWCLDGLEKFTGFATSNDVVNYLLSIESEEDLRDFVNGILTPLNAEKRHFVDELVRKVDFESRAAQKEHGSISVENYRIYQKEDCPPGFSPSNSAAKNKNRKKNKQDISQGLNDSNLPSEETGHQLPKGSNKYVPLYDARGKESVVLLPGRHLCDCQATRHTLIRNCLSCGRIVCEQERAGPCLFCGDFVATREDMEMMKRVSQKGKKLYEKFMSVHNRYLTDRGMPTISTELPESGPPIGGFRQPIMSKEPADTLSSITASICENSDETSDKMAEQKFADESKADEFKNRLLNYDRTSSKRTQVIDDESDYFGSDLWESPEERQRKMAQEQRLRDERVQEKKARTITIDILGRQVVESVNNLSIYERAKLEDEASSMKKLTLANPDLLALGNSQGTFPTLKGNSKIEAPTFVALESEEGLKQSYLQAVKDNAPKGLKLQDSFLQEMTDQGLCLSMHQPWASLLVAGIKRFEGRDWYTTHRGRLWIASTAKASTQEEVERLHQSYRIILNDENLQFPQEYPTGCLLGCVDIVDCLTQEQYTDQYSLQCSECSDSSYVWVCENPVELQFKFPVIGKPKIWKLEPEKHKAAKKTLKL